MAWLEALSRDVQSPEVLTAFVEMLGVVAGPEAAFFAVDRNQRVVHWSPGAQRMFGLTSDEMLGEHCLRANRCETCMRGCGLQNVGRIDGVELDMHRSNREPLRVRKFARAFHNVEGQFVGGIEVLLPNSALRLVEPGRLKSRSAGQVVDFHGLQSVDPAMHEAFETIRNVANTEVSVLIRGESGTGKELAAKSVHLESKRHKGPFLAINCAALSPHLLESELFGHVKGAFTGAIRDRPGLFREAEGGTLFLDEIAELPLELQAKLLRVLQERNLVPVGATRPIKVDVRIVSATHTSLRNRVREGRFREDLMYRLRVVPVFLPPLRERKGDIELLLHRLIAEANQHNARKVLSISNDAMNLLLNYRWPGNIRELHNVVQYAFAVGRGPELDAHQLPPELRETPQDRTEEKLESAESGGDEAERIRQSLKAAGGNVGEAAKMLGMSRPTFWRHRKRLGI
jgi:two-component system response regulator AtoC